MAPSVGWCCCFLLTLATNNRALYERNFALAAGRERALSPVALLAVLSSVGAGAPGRAPAARRFGSRLLIAGGHLRPGGVVPGCSSTSCPTSSSRAHRELVRREGGGCVDGRVSLARVTLDTIASDLATNTRSASSPAGAGARRRGRRGAGAHARSSSGLRTWCCGMPRASPWPGSGNRAIRSTPSAPARSNCAPRARSASAVQIEGLDDINDPMAAENARARVLVLVASRAWAVGRAALPAGHPASAPGPGGQRHRRAGGQPRIPGARWRAVGCGACTSAR